MSRSVNNAVALNDMKTSVCKTKEEAPIKIKILLKSTFSIAPPSAPSWETPPNTAKIIEENIPRTDTISIFRFLYFVSKFSVISEIFDTHSSLSTKYSAVPSNHSSIEFFVNVKSLFI